MLDSLALAAAVGLLVQALRVRKAARKADGGAHKKEEKVFHSVDIPTDEEGRVHHLGVKPGDVAQRVLSVGDVGRAARIASQMDGGKPASVVSSSRGFVTHTGTFKGVPVSIVATGMGTPMMDFVVRETRAVVRGPMAFLRLGTCGGLGKTVPGSLVVPSKGSVLVRREPDVVTAALAGKSSDPASSPTAPPAASSGLLSATPALPYSVTNVVMPDAHLSDLFAKYLALYVEDHYGPEGATRFPVVHGVDATADSFYSSQGRANPAFNDNNAELVNVLERVVPDITCLQMETFHLYDLARAAKAGGNAIAASAAHIALVNRLSADIVSKQDMLDLEVVGGRAALHALAEFPLAA